MFGIGLGEMLIIFLVALLAFGPEKLPSIARSIAKLLAQLRSAQNELRYTLMNAEQELKRMPIMEEEKKQAVPVIKPVSRTDVEVEPAKNEVIHG